MRENKKAALELSIGTIVVWVIAITMLILGIIFVRSIMCSGIMLTEKMSKGVEKEITDLFGSNEYGIRCMGEGGHEIKLGDGGRRHIGCVINQNTQTEYKLTVKKVTSLKGASTKTVEGWILDKNWEGSVSPGITSETVMILDVPQKVSDSSIKIEIEELNLNTEAKKTHYMALDITHTGAFNSAVC